jgi:serine/threonine protein kinase
MSRLQGPDVVKLLDFGISLDLHEIRLKDGASSSPDGTPRYMAPEQLYASPDIDGRADQFSLAAMTYELLSGKPAFNVERSRTVIAVHDRHLDPLFSEDPGSSERIDSVLRRATSLRPRDRFENIGAFGESFEEAAISSPTSTMAPPSGVRLRAGGAETETLRVKACSSWS